jgi:cytoskeleton protein RodZ
MNQSDSAGSLGAYLRGLREARGGSLEEMAHATRIGARRLGALEREEFCELPAPVFVKGFIQAYCGFLGESAEEALVRYRRILGEGAAASAARAPRPRPAPSWRASPIVASLALLVIFGIGLLALNLGLRRAPETVAVDPAVAAIGTGRSTATSASAPSAAPAPSAPAVRRLTVKALETTWIRVETDAGRVVEELLQPGATREWTSGTRFWLTVGNAGGIALELDGRPLARLGDRGAVIRRLELPQPEPGAGS